MANTYHGKPCKWGHGTLRYSSNTRCVECRKIEWHSEAKRKGDKEYRVRNLEKLRAYDRKRNKQPRRQASIRQAIRNWELENPEKKRAIGAAARSRKRQALMIPFTESEWLQKYRHQFNGCCAYCQKRIDFSELTQDHVIPLNSNYREHSLRNLVPACKSCNYSKVDKPVFEWLKANDRHIPMWLFDLLTVDWFLLGYAETIKSDFLKD